MPLSFAGIYMLSDVNQNYVKASQIAMAPRKVKVRDPNSEDLHDEYQFLVPNPVNLGHAVSGKVTKDEEGAFEIEDDSRESNDAAPILWRFEPLTLKLWNEMGEKGEIGGWDELKDDLKSDQDVLVFYRREWLTPALDWWNEKIGPAEAAETEAAKPTAPTE